MEEYCACLCNTDDLIESYCLVKKTRKLEDDSCIGVQKDSFMVGTGDAKYYPKKAQQCPCFTTDSSFAGKFHDIFSRLK